ncbi:hypothetical protein TNCV_2393811 [Trichonephila clavipes]|nr:hypothetical protein TNCV_2393811 [Trichonephila clavipes]
MQRSISNGAPPRGGSDQDFPPADISPKFSRYTGFSSDCCLQEFDLTLLRNSDDRSNCETPVAEEKNCILEVRNARSLSVLIPRPSW